MDAELRAAIAAAVGEAIVSARPVSGGDINDAWIVETASGSIFVKSRRGAPPSTFVAEARGLRWLAAADALQTPRVIATHESPPLLVLAVVHGGHPQRGFDRALGRGLAQLHLAHPSAFGLDHDNFIGPLPQDNTTTETWPDFYWRRRLLPLVERGHTSGRIPTAVRHDFDRLATCLPSRCGPIEPPARLHGDLWSGNLMVGEHGQPVLIDPAVYGGHREIDLAMMKLFGGFSAEVFDSYDEVYPLDKHWRERIPLYQLYPLLVHVNLLGGGYIDGVRRALAAML